MVRAKGAITRALAPLARPWLFMTRDRLRVLGYHDVPESASFRRQVEYLVERFRVTSPALLNEQQNSERPPVWITFDDGDPSVVNVALPILDEYGLHATLFVCPGLVDTEEPYWWQVVHAAAQRGLVMDVGPVTPQLVSRLKQLPDRSRLEMVRAIRVELEGLVGEPFRVPQLTSEQLSAWLEAGHTVGNHTWDHPILDQCEEEVQLEQIESAHRWLVDQVSPKEFLFAYPNGNWTEVGEKMLGSLGYETAVLFDHRLARLNNPLRVSRIRVNATDDMETFRIRVSGLHPTLHHISRREKSTSPGG